MEADISRNDEDGRYELRVDGEVVSFAEFRERPGAIVVPHVETRIDRRGEGLSTLLMDGVVEDLIERSLKIVPLCPFARAHVVARPDADDLIAQ